MWGELASEVKGTAGTWAARGEKDGTFLRLQVFSVAWAQKGSRGEEWWQWGWKGKQESDFDLGPPG